MIRADRNASPDAVYYHETARISTEGNVVARLACYSVHTGTTRADGHSPSSLQSHSSLSEVTMQACASRKAGYGMSAVNLTTESVRADADLIKSPNASPKCEK